MKVLVVGNGGREHALAWEIRQSPRLTQLWIAPGNAGTAQESENVPIAADDITGIVAFAKNADFQQRPDKPCSPRVEQTSNQAFTWPISSWLRRNGIQNPMAAPIAIIISVAG